MKDWTSEKELSTAERLQSHAEWLRNFRREAGLHVNNARGLEDRAVSYPFSVFNLFFFQAYISTRWAIIALNTRNRASVCSYI